MTLAELALLFAVGLFAGFVNALAGGSGFLVFPALMAAGLPPIAANASSFIALAPANLVGCALHYRHVAKAHHSVPLRALIAAVGGALGALILVSTGSEAFERAVPWLLLTATLFFALGPWVKHRLERAFAFEGFRFPLLLYAAEFLMCVYGGYFGIGMGIVMLAIYEILGESDMLVANAVKNFVLAIVTLIGIGFFATFGLIHWGPALTMCLGAGLGGYVAVRVSERVPRSWLRLAILIWAVSLTFYAFAVVRAA